VEVEGPVQLLTELNYRQARLAFAKFLPEQQAMSKVFSAEGRRETEGKEREEK
jgi:hypothetical protein